MKKEFFKQHIKFFTLKEIAAVGSRIEDLDLWLMIYLNTLRKVLDLPITITSLTEGIHVKNSLHYSGKAVDFKIAGRIPKQKVVENMIDVGFRGIGVYRGFFHGDVRDETKFWKRENGIYKSLF